MGTEQESVVGASVADAEVVTCVGPRAQALSSVRETRGKSLQRAVGGAEGRGRAVKSVSPSTTQ